MAVLRRTILVRVANHEIRRLEQATTSESPLHHDTDSVAEHLRRRSMRANIDRLHAIGHLEAQIERLRIPLHRSRHHLSAEPQRHVVRARSFCEELLWR